MGKIFTLDATTIQIMADAIDDMIFYLGKDCKLVYPPKITPCVNCVQDPIGTKSKNIYLHGGPYPFPQGSICPLCDGEGGTRAEEISEIVRFIIHWNPKTYQNIRLDNVRLAAGVLKIKGYLSDFPKLRACSYMIPHIDIAAYQNYRFRLSSEPVSGGNIVQGRYFTALLDRVPS